ncbi:MAG: retropepsin-like aspartic protease family protein [Maritimibacter sp.]
MNDLNSFDFGRLVYLVLLGAVVGGYFFASGRRDLSKTAQQSLIWVLIFVGFIAGFGLWNDMQADLTARQTQTGVGVIEVPRGADGHFHLVLEVNGTSLPFLVDTGASSIVLPKAAARKIGLDPDRLTFSDRAMTANGEVATAPARVREIRLGDIIDRNVLIYVNEGALDDPLLGMDYLSRFKSVEMARDTLILTR